MKYILVTILALMLSSCFSAKGLPLKSVKTEITTNNTETNQLEENLETLKESVSKTVTENTKAATTNTINIDHSSWHNLLQKYVKDNGNVDYIGFKSEINTLNIYVNYLATQIPTEKWTIQDQLAYFINVYNANTIKLIVDNYPTKSIKDISNPWSKNRIKIGIENYSLADIENGILRKMNEPRIHFAINCASIGCPKLLNKAYTKDNVMALMEEATIEFINNDNKNKISADSIKISEIFKWYKNDFTQNGSLIDYINTYSKTKINTNTKVNYKNYDWNLNDIE